MRILKVMGPEALAVLSAFGCSVIAALASGCSASDDAPVPASASSGLGDASSETHETGATRAPDGPEASTDAGSDTASSAPELIFPRTGISAAELGVIVNDADPLSVSVANYYVATRKIPAANLVHLTIPAKATLSEAEFTPLKTQVDAAFAGTHVQALALTWTQPYAVVNMSITSAFALGFRAIGDTCTDPKSQYGTTTPYASKPDSTEPFTDLAFRPAMTLPATTLAEGQALVDRGVASDDTWPKGTAYLMNTSDQTRSARCITNVGYGWNNECQALLDVWDPAASGVAASIVVADSVTNKTDILFYVQGLASVPDIATNTFLPGAVADHLTSYGGPIPTSGQMSAFVFLANGATGSYGTVVEPCAYQQKFPNPAVLVPRYFGGNTLIEAYWKSVLWPAEGIFIGEPLARPFGTGFRSKFAGGSLTIETTTMKPTKLYVIEAADSAAGPFTPVLDNLSVTKYGITSFTIPNATRHTYRFSAK